MQQSWGEGGGYMARHCCNAKLANGGHRPCSGVTQSTKVYFVHPPNTKTGQVATFSRRFTHTTSALQPEWVVVRYT